MTASDISHHPNGLPRRLSAAECVALVRELVEEGGRVVHRPHALQRMEERDITMAQVFAVLRRGDLVEGPTWDRNYSNWKFGMEGLSAGEMISVRAAIDVERLMGKVVLVLTTF